MKKNTFECINAGRVIMGIIWGLAEGRKGKNYFNKFVKKCKENEELKEQIAELKKNALEWHKVTCFDKPDENGWITCDAPSVSGIVYLVKLKDGGHEIRELEEYDGCTFFEDLEWEEIEAWAEIPEGM